MHSTVWCVYRTVLQSVDDMMGHCAVMMWPCCMDLTVGHEQQQQQQACMHDFGISSAHHNERYVRALRVMVDEYAAVLCT